MSSHREAPLISQDPVADNTDVYAFVSPDDPTKVTLIANYIPLEEPAGGPNFHQFGEDVLYEIKVDNDGDGLADITYQFRFTNILLNPETFLYNTGPISSLDDPAWNMRQVYSVTRVTGRVSRNATLLGTDLASPPVRIGPRSTPGYPSLAGAAVHSLPGGIKVFAGQREEAFNVDLGSIFDLGGLRPFNLAHLIPLATDPDGADATKGFNVHSIALQVPKTELTRDGSNPTDSLDDRSVIGMWASASRQKAHIRGARGEKGQKTGPWVQVSRLGNPLINEVIIPLGNKDRWNGEEPHNDEAFLPYYEQPELQRLLPALYPNVFPNLAGITDARADLVAILLTGIPPGLPGVPSDYRTFTGSAKADMLRLNMAIPPATLPSPFGLLGGDVAGFPNGRRVSDNVVAIELRAISGATYPLVNSSYTPDSAAFALTDGTSNDVAPLPAFPYLGHPHQGYEHEHDD